MEKDPDYPYLEIYPPFSFYMTSDNGDQDQVVYHYDTSGIVGGNLMPDSTEDISTTVTQPTLGQYHGDSTLSSSLSINDPANCASTNQRDDDCFDPGFGLTSAPSFRSLMGNPDPPYSVECDYISDIEYEPDSGFNSAATSPAPSESFEATNIVENRSLLSPGGTTLNQKNLAQNDESYTMVQQPAIDEQHATIACNSSPGLLEPFVESIKCVVTAPSPVLNINGGLQARSRSTNTNTVTVSTYYPRMNTGKLPERYLNPNIRQTSEGHIPYLSAPTQAPRYYAPQQPQIDYPSLPPALNRPLNRPYQLQMLMPYPPSYSSYPLLPREFGARNKPWDCLGLNRPLSPSVPPQWNNADWRIQEHVIYRPAHMRDVRPPHVAYSSPLLNPQCRYSTRPWAIGSYPSTTSQHVHSFGMPPPKRTKTELDTKPVHPNNFDESLDLDKTACWTDSFDEFSMEKGKSAVHVMSFDEFSMEKGKSAVHVMSPDSTTQHSTDTNPAIKKKKPSKPGVSKRNQKPPETYMILIAKAILSSPKGRASLTEIYEHIMKQHSFYRDTTLSWRNAVRHNLSTNECFVKAGRTEAGRGYYWAIHPSSAEAFRKGNFDRRLARRKAQHASRTGDPEDVINLPVPPPPLAQTCNIPDSSQTIEQCYLPPHLI